MSFGHRTLHPEKVEIHSASAYFQAMEGAGVVVDHGAVEIILSAAKALAREMAGRPLRIKGCWMKSPVCASIRLRLGRVQPGLPQTAEGSAHHGYAASPAVFPILGDGGTYCRALSECATAAQPAVWIMW